MSKTRELVMTAIGQATMCWEKVGRAGKFNDKKAKEIGDKLIKDLNRANRDKLAGKKKKKK